jgi:hypothetical protein
VCLDVEYTWRVGDDLEAGRRSRRSVGADVVAVDVNFGRGVRLDPQHDVGAQRHVYSLRGRINATPGEPHVDLDGCDTSGE